METNWYVIAGGVCSGKTTIVTELAKRGYATVPEAAREVIDEQLQAGKSLEEVRGDVLAFQRAVLKRIAQHEAFVPKDKLTFFDRGRPDARAFLAFNKIPEPEDITREIEKASYRKVFMLEPLSHVSDYYRIEKPEEIALLHEEHVRAYESLALTIVYVPVLPVEERIELILRGIS